jgi:hypothetical protein
MMSVESASAQKESESPRHETATASTEVALTGGVTGLLGAQWLDHELMAQPANAGARALALRRAQQAHGNRYVQRLVAASPSARSSGRVVQRQCACGGTCPSCKADEMDAAGVAPTTENAAPGGEKQRPIQMRAAGGDAPQAVPAVELFPTGGQPLDASTRDFMESRFRSDLGDVRVHTDVRAAASAEALGADAYTSGQDIYFADGKYAPKTTEGRHLLAHELTHTVQQRNGETPVAASRAGGFLVGDAADPLEGEAERTADAVVQGEDEIPAVSRDGTPKVRRGIASFASDVLDVAGDAWSATGGRVVSAAVDLAEDAAEAIIERLAPGVLPLLRGLGNFLYEKITAGIDSLFGGIASRIQHEGVVGALTSVLGSLGGSLSKALGGLVSGSCHSMVEAASAIVGFVKEIGGEAFAALGRVASAVGGFFSDFWDDFGAPALDAIKKVAGAAWAWIVDKAKWLWDKLEPIRSALGKAWDWLKKQFGIAKEEAEGILDSLYDKAKEQWFKVRDKIAPILNALKLVAGALLLLSPLGPIIIVWKVAPYLWEALQWIWSHGISPVTEKIRAELREHVLPFILQGIDAITAKLDEASAFLCGHAATIASGLRSLESALSGIPFLKLASGVVGGLAQSFEHLAAKGKCKFSDVLGEVKSVLRRIYQHVKPILELLRQFVLVATLGPWAILDDGVWKTLNGLVELAKKTPCIREIAGLLHVDGIMAKVGEIRTALKDIWQVVTDEKRFEAEIHKRLDGMLTAIPSQALTIFGALAGLSGPHLDALLRRFLLPKIAQFIARGPALLIDMAWGLLWPWPDVIEQYHEIENQVGKLKSSLWDFEFSKAADAGLAIWRGVNGIAGQLYGWFFLAAVLIGAVFGAPEAGAAVAYEAGEALLASTLLAETLSLDKARLNLLLRSRRGKSESQLQQEDDEDYQTIADSTMNLAIMGIMAILGAIAVDFAKAVFAEIKSVFLPRGAKAPKVELPVKPTEIPPAETPTIPKEAPAKPTEVPSELAEKLPEDTVAKAEENGIPLEQLEKEFGELRQKANNPENVRQPAEAGFDAEMDAGEHKYDRNEVDRTWCRESKKVCELNVGDDVNAKVDKAKKSKSAKPLPEEGPPVEEPKPPESTGGEEPPQRKLTRDKILEKVRGDLKEVGDKLYENQKELSRLAKEIGEARKEVQRLKEKALNSTGEARKAALKELKAARDVLRDEEGAGLLDEQQGYLEERSKLLKDEARLLESLKLERPALRASTKAKIEAAAERTPDGKHFLDANTNEVITGEYDYGHKYGFEHRRLVLEALQKGMSQAQFNDWVNSHPEWFQIETTANNRSHIYEKPGID